MLATNKQEWLKRYKAHLIAAGIDSGFAQDDTDEAEVDLTIEPEAAAADELSYMAEDSQ